MVVHGWKLRIKKTYGGNRCHLMIRQMECRSCGRYHNELPDELVPHKHYETEVVENVVDGVSTPDDDTTENYPCEMTMQRWKDWISGNKSQIDGQLRSSGDRLQDSGSGLPESMDSLLDRLRSGGAGWLSTVTRAIYNLGGALKSGRQLLADHLICFPVPGDADVSSPQKEVIHHGIKSDRKLAGQPGTGTLPDPRAPSG